MRLRGRRIAWVLALTKEKQLGIAASHRTVAHICFQQRLN